MASMIGCHDVKPGVVQRPGEAGVSTAVLGKTMGNLNDTTRRRDRCGPGIVLISS